jgi:hypothetical protein
MDAHAFGSNFTAPGQRNDFLLKPGTYFVTGKTPKDMQIDDNYHEP